MTEEDIKNIETYDPTTIKNIKELRDDWRIVTAWFSQILSGREFTYSLEQVINLASLIFEELKERGTEFHPGKMKPAAKKLFEIVSKKELKVPKEDALDDLAKIIRSGEKMGETITLQDVLPSFKSFYTTKPLIYLVGGLCNHPEEGTTGDIDILIRKKKPLVNEELPMVFRIYRMFEKDMWHRIQILWSNDDFGPFTNFIPLYDQLIERRDDSTKVVLMSSEEELLYSLPEMDEEHEDVLRTKKEAILKSAAVSKRSGIRPGRFFEMLKGIAGYRKQEVYSIPGVLEIVNPKDYPFEVDEKYDGMRIQIHKDGNTVKILSIDGADLTSKLSFIADELKKKKGSFVLDTEMTGWTKGFRKGTHLGRSDVAGFVHAKEKLPHHNFFLNAFDILYADGKDLSDEPLSTRRAALEKLGGTEHVKVIDMKLAKDEAGLKKAIKWAAGIPGSEGAMIKSWASTYPLGGRTSKWIKFKKEVDLDAEVIDVHQVKGSKSKNYLAILRNAQGDPIPVGRTYNTPIQAKKGDIIRVAFVNLNMYKDKKTGRTWFNWWAPRVIEKREDKTKPDNDLTARRIHKSTEGEFDEKPYPKRYREALGMDVNKWLEDFPAVFEELDILCNLSEDEMIELGLESPLGPGCQRAVSQDEPVFDANPFLTPGSEDKTWKFVMQNHHRGKSVHGDLRLERPSFLVGWTLNYQIAGKPSKDIDTLVEAKQFAKDPDDIKSFRPTKQVVTEKKAPEPLQWLTVQGVFKPGEVGATKEKEGVFYIPAKGEVEFGTQRPHFHEYFLKSSGDYDMNGRLVVRLLKNIWEPKLTGRKKFVWMTRFTKDEFPYIITKRAVDLGVMPPKGLSWLPKAVRKQIPRGHRYWELSGKKAQSARDELVDAIKKGIVIIKVKTSDVSEFPQSGKFALSHICWRGQIVVRLGCSRQEWHVFLENGDKTYDIILDSDPTETLSSPATIGKPKDKKFLTYSGKLQNKTLLNPDKKTPAFMKQLEKGTFKTIEDEEGRKVIQFKSAKFTGKFELLREDSGPLWSFKKI